MTISGFTKCPFCKDPFTAKSVTQHTNHCKKNPDAKKRKSRKLIIDKTLYDFTLNFLKEHKYINSRNLARDYHNITYRKMDRSEACEFRDIISALIEEKIIGAYNNNVFKRIDENFNKIIDPNNIEALRNG